LRFTGAAARRFGHRSSVTRLLRFDVVTATERYRERQHEGTQTRPNSIHHRH
jgi:hypothetical protein